MERVGELTEQDSCLDPILKEAVHACAHPTQTRGQPLAMSSTDGVTEEVVRRATVPKGEISVTGEFLT